MSAGEDSSHASLIAHISEDATKGIRRVPIDGDGPEGKPEPHDRPDERAQWDEVNGRWIEWDEPTQKWVAAPEGPPPPAPAAADDASEPPADQ